MKFNPRALALLLLILCVAAMVSFFGMSSASGATLTKTATNIALATVVVAGRIPNLPGTGIGPVATKQR